jgi:glycosyltransferase involved in cell wall biosynthesis
MRIAQVSPLFESVPPKMYGGTERIVSYLTEGLVNNGHEVTLFASGDSITKARLLSTCEKSLRLFNKDIDPLILHLIQLKDVVNHAGEFDIIHFHTDYIHFPTSSICNYSHVTTLHGRLDLKGLEKIFSAFKDMPLVSISNNQRKPIPDANWISTVHHGLPLHLYDPVYTDGKYLAFIGRISPEKRVDRAIEIAKKCHMPLMIAAKIDTEHEEYFNKEIRHLFDDPLIHFIGEIKEAEKNNFLGNASALLFPIDWPEPFGLVLLEAMACGTPVVSYDCGAVREIVKEGVNGRIVGSINESVDAVINIKNIDRKSCRKYFEENFISDIMVKNYESVYESIIKKKEANVNQD